jgi:putative ABC transport system substrate-binding protein
MKAWKFMLLSAIAMSAHAQPGMPHLCFLTFDAATLEKNRYGSFFQTLRERGYVPGQTIRIDYLSAAGTGQPFPALAEACVRSKADIIATTTTPAAQAAKATTQSIPIVMLITGDPLGSGLVQSLAKPGGNVTGQSFMAGDLSAKRLEILKEAVPGVARVLVLTYAVDPISAPQIRAMEAAGARLGVRLLVREIRHAGDIPAALIAGLKESPDALLVTSESILFENRARIIEFAIHERLPGVYPWRAAALAGGLMSYAQDNEELFRRAALQVDRVLKGARPADLPVEQPTTFDFVINMKTARALGVQLPNSLLLRATQVIE